MSLKCLCSGFNPSIHTTYHLSAHPWLLFPLISLRIKTPI
ncbi:hypothetical protein M7I_1942 [Glarea lozoyensis 74030]|uniref:Uncharacterized protein n=1 Tax=Glarea lozoyensis (strain ATCC 74030 / MF5533) TaxID=1104152 RepID=H0EHG3_GLAL7|nr:hypothetical protein M7I_1942 [Glarea lozoyensis 74030]